VHYPGLTSHPEHRLAREQQKGFGAVISFELHGGEPQVRAFLESLSLFTLAESLGGVESLVCHPGSMTHAAMTEEAQRDAGIEPTLLRLSINATPGLSRPCCGYRLASSTALTWSGISRPVWSEPPVQGPPAWSWPVTPDLSACNSLTVR
jgi:hypothetical protein